MDAFVVWSLVLAAILAAMNVAAWRTQRFLDRQLAGLREAKARRTAAYHKSHRQTATLYGAKVQRFIAERRLVEMRRAYRLAEMRDARAG